MVKESVDFLSLNVLVKSNGIVIFNTEDNTLELFNDLDREFKVIENSPVYNDNREVDGSPEVSSLLRHGRARFLESCQRPHASQAGAD